jgi:tetratricopeptide (TPR) repeat protein
MTKPIHDSARKRPAKQVATLASSTLRFTIDEFDDSDTGKPTQFGRFSRNWDEEQDLDVLLDEMESGRISDKQALIRARKLEASYPDNLEIQNFIANRLWALELRDEATEIYEHAFNQALGIIPKGFKGQIAWSEIDNRSFLRLAHGTLLGLMHRHEGKPAMVLAKKLLAWCPMDNLGIRFLLGDISLMQGDSKAAMKAYLKGAQNSPAHWYQAGLIAFREGDFVAACTYLRRGIAANPYIAEGLTGRTLLAEHLYWHFSNINGPEWAIDYLEAPVCDWSPEEIDFMDWVFNTAEVLKERASLMELHEGLTYEHDAERREPYVRQISHCVGGISDDQSKSLIRKVKNRYGMEIWPWDRAGFRNIPPIKTKLKAVK